MQNKSPVIAIMPTGSGKSLLFMLPAMCSPQDVSIVVVPLIALRGNIQTRCDNAGIKCQQWDPRRMGFGGDIVLVMPESALTEAFESYINLLRETRLLDRIVIDECHMILNEQTAFRKQLPQLGNLVCSTTQLILITAMLPRHRKVELWRRMYLEAKEVHLFRASTTRINVRYGVQLLPPGITAEQEADLVAGKVRQAL